MKINMTEKKNWKPGNLLNPVPVVMVTSMRPGEKPNVFTVAWTGTVCSVPPMVSISVRPSRYSYGIIQDTGEFVINLVNEDLVEAADYCGVKSGRDEDKFDVMGLAPQPVEGVSCPGIAQSPLQIACRVNKKIELGSHDMFIADIVGVSVAEELVDEKGRLDLDRAGLVAYSHGEYIPLDSPIGSFGFSVKKKK